MHLSSAPAAALYLACALGTLPAVSFVDPEFGATSDIGNPLMSTAAITTTWPRRRALLPPLSLPGGPPATSRAATSSTAPGSQRWWCRRTPAVSVTDVTHDHTTVLATIDAKLLDDLHP
jgi:hypothetical protein